MNFDVDSIKARMLTNLRSKTSWASVLFFSTNMRLIEIVAEALAELARYDEYLTREAKWELAQNKSSLIAQATKLDYFPHRKVGATGSLRISASATFNATPAKNITIPRWTTFSGSPWLLDYARSARVSPSGPSQGGKTATFPETQPQNSPNRELPKTGV